MPGPANETSLVERYNPRVYIPKFADIASLNDDSIDLATAALVIAADEYPGLDLELYLDKLEQIASEARNTAAALADASDIIQAINSVLFLEYGYHGNKQSYYDPRNSYLNQVIDRRTGIPITLSVLYMAVADRVGLPVLGVGMPGHFLVKHAGPSGEVYIDSFNGGRLMDAAGCAKLVEDISGAKLELRPEHLSAVSKKQILTRMLANLAGIYSEGKDYARAIRAVDYILMIDANQPTYVRDRGLLLAASGRKRDSIESLERYLKLSPDSRDAPQIRDSIKRIRAQLSELN
jgi:regulator of sirC expression with transglutaminase-like and TPR domain